jgi:hypothetical protein
MKRARVVRCVSSVPCTACNAGLVDTELSPCGHMFHSKCLVRWLAYWQRCPLCHAAIKGTTLATPPARNSASNVPYMVLPESAHSMQLSLSRRAAALSAPAPLTGARFFTAPMLPAPSHVMHRSASTGSLQALQNRALQTRASVGLLRAMQAPTSSASGGGPTARLPAFQCHSGGAALRLLRPSAPGGPHPISPKRVRASALDGAIPLAPVPVVAGDLSGGRGSPWPLPGDGGDKKGWRAPPSASPPPLKKSKSCPSLGLLCDAMQLIPCRDATWVLE